MKNESTAHTEEATADKVLAVNYGQLFQSYTMKKWSVLIDYPKTRTHDVGEVAATVHGATQEKCLELAELLASAPSLKAENDRLREANMVMLDALKEALWQLKAYNTTTYAGEEKLLEGTLIKAVHEKCEAAIAIGEGRHGV